MSSLTCVPFDFGRDSPFPPMRAAAKKPKAAPRPQMRINLDARSVSPAASHATS